MADGRESGQSGAGQEDETKFSIEISKGYLDAAAEQGIRIEDIPAGWQQLEFDTADGRIVLEPTDINGDGVIVAQVIESEDPSVPVGNQITITGITMGGAWFKSGVIGPNARLSFHRWVVDHYKLGDTDDHGAKTMTPATIDEYTTNPPSHIFKKTEDGMSIRAADPAPLASSFVRHASGMYEADGKPKNVHFF